MKKLTAVAFFYCLSSTTSAQESSRDSVKTYQAAEVVVTATRTKIALSDSPFPVELIERLQIQAMNGSTVADVLRNSNGVFLRDYGSNGALKTISMRGASSAQVLVLLNGVRFNSMQNGLVDLSLLPLNDVERIEIVRGGSSALYGADAVGGVVNIMTRPSGSDFRVRAEGSTGSFGFRRYLVEGEGEVAGLGLIAGLSDERGKDDFPYVRGQLARIENRQNADFLKRQSYIHGDIGAGHQTEVKFSAQYVRAERGAPGSISFLSAAARQNDDDVNFVGTVRSSLDGGSEIVVRSGFHYNFETYDDPDPSFPIRSVYKNIFASLNPQFQVFLSSNYRMVFGGEFGQGVLDGNDFDGRIKRVQRSVYWSNEVQWSYDRTTIDRISVYGTIRYDHVSDVDRAVTPKVGLNVRLFKDGDVRFRTSFGRNFRAPSFNDMYYRGFSNPNLRPERSTTFDAGLMARAFYDGEHAIEVTYFNLDTEDRILFDPVSFLPVNIGRAAAIGFELKYNGNFLDDRVSLGLNYSSTSARKKNRFSDADPTFDRQLIYVPKDVLNTLVSFRLNQVALNVSYNLVGERFIVEDNSAALPAYGLMNVNVRVNADQLGASLFLKLELNNVFDKDYEVFKDYPMPQRSYRATVGLQY